LGVLTLSEQQGLQQEEYPVPVIQGEGEQGNGVRLGIDLTLCPQDWLPEATNKRVRFTARIYTFNEGNEDWEYKGEVGEKREITFSFREVSTEPGVCMNFPAIDRANENPDLFFPDDGHNEGKFNFFDDDTDGGKPCPTEILNRRDNAAHNRHYKRAITTVAVSEATIEVRCEDYGAYGILRASAPDCETLEPRRAGEGCSQRGGDNDVKIPRDAHGNNIADSTPHNDGGAAANRDEDNDPVGDGTRGDGLTNYEEYRGFIVKSGVSNRHVRTDITRKDIFIRDRDGLGTGLFSQSGLVIHLLPGAEYYGGDSPDDPAPGNRGTSQVRAAGDRTQVINFNSGYAHGGDQHGLRLVNEVLSLGSGHTYATNPNSPGPPKNVNRVAVDQAYIASRGINNKLSKTIAHELGHAVCLRHHGPLAQNWKKHYHGIFFASPKWGTEGDRQVLKNPRGLSDQEGGPTSGVVNCVMRYDNLFAFWCHNNDKCRHRIYKPPQKEVLNNLTFCSDRNGTGINNVPDPKGGNPHRNDAERGDCKSQMKVKDW
jgi:hypothetical protein